MSFSYVTHSYFWRLTAAVFVPTSVQWTWRIIVQKALGIGVGGHVDGAEQPPGRELLVQKELGSSMRWKESPQRAWGKCWRIQKPKQMTDSWMWVGEKFGGGDIWANLEGQELTGKTRGWGVGRAGAAVRRARQASRTGQADAETVSRLLCSGHRIWEMGRDTIR